MNPTFWVASILVKGTLLLVGALLVAATLRRASAALRHLVWSAGLATVLLLPLVSVTVPWRLPVALLTLPAAPVAAPAPFVAPETPNASRSRPNDATTPSRPAGEASAIVPPPAPASSPIALAALWSRISVAQLAVSLWAAGALFLLARLGIGALVLARVVRKATTLNSSDWTHPLLEAADRLALDRLPRLVMSDRLPMPFACGVLNPAIVLPTGAAEWEDRRRRAVLFHELAHLRRFDLVVNALGQIACAVYWFHPLIWVAARQLRVESERACDDLVLGVGTRASEYADHLLQIVCRAAHSRTPAVALPMAQRHEFEGRMLAILERGAHREPASGRHAVLLSALALGLVVPLAALGPARAQPAEPIAPSMSQAPTLTDSVRTPARSTRDVAARQPTAAPSPAPSPSPAPALSPSAR
ncbi:MAG TPA: M56 family metallopeptidase, partial [Gemmatimonadales bacterium]